MSSYPGTPTPLAPFLRNGSRDGSVDVPKTSITGTLTAPGLEITPPVSQAAIEFAQVEHALGLAGDLAGAIGSGIRRDTAEIDATRREVEQEIKQADILSVQEERMRQAQGEANQRAEKAEAKFAEREAAALQRAAHAEIRGLAATDAPVSLQEFADQIESGKIAVPVSQDQDADAIARLIDAKLATIGPDERAVYGPVFTRAVSGGLARAFSRRREVVYEESKRDSFIAYAADIASAQSPEQVDEVLNTATTMYADVKRPEAEAALLLPALQAAATDARADRFDMIAGKVTNRALDSRVSQLREHLKERQEEEKGRFVQRFVNNIAGMEADGVDPEVIIERVETDRGIVGNDVANRLIQGQQKAIEARDAREAADTYLRTVRSHVKNAAVTGGLATIPENPQIYDRHGNPVPGGREAAELAFAAEMEEAARSAGDDPQRALANQATVASQNGAVYKPWQRVMNGGATVAFTDLTAEDVATGKAAIPANLVSGYELWKRLGAINPRLRANHVNEQAETLYDLADAAGEYMAPGDDRQALALAMKAMARPTPLPLINSAGIDSAVSDIADSMWRTNAQNVDDIRQALTRQAQLLRRTGMVPNEREAVRVAQKQLAAKTRVVNGWAINTARAGIPDGLDLDSITQVLAQDYANKYGEEEGVDASDIALVPGETPATFMLVNMRTKGLLDEFGETVYPTSRLMEIARERKIEVLDAADRSKKARRRKAELQAIRAEIPRGEFEYLAPLVRPAGEKK